MRNMKIKTFSKIMLVWLVIVCNGVWAEQSTKPNIVYILADDMGWKDGGFHGADIKTPTLDQLASGGARLEQMYAQPMCTPSRAALMTGLRLASE